MIPKLSKIKIIDNPNNIIFVIQFKNDKEIKHINDSSYFSGMNQKEIDFIISNNQPSLSFVLSKIDKKIKYNTDFSFFRGKHEIEIEILIKEFKKIINSILLTKFKCNINEFNFEILDDSIINNLIYEKIEIISEKFDKNMHDCLSIINLPEEFMTFHFSHNKEHQMNFLSVNFNTNDYINIEFSIKNDDILDSILEFLKTKSINRLRYLI